jgi:DNA processing protein
LIKQGAKLVESAQDILEELQYAATATVMPAMTAAPDFATQAIDAQAARVLEALGFDAVDADTLAGRCQLDIAALNAQLLTLELSRRLEILPGNLYRRLD